MQREGGPSARGREGSGGKGGAGPAEGRSGEQPGGGQGGDGGAGRVQWRREVAAAVRAAMDAGENVLVHLKAVGTAVAQPAVVRCERVDGREVGALLVSRQGGASVARIDLRARKAVTALQGATLRIGLLGGARGDTAGTRRWQEELGALRAATGDGREARLQLLEAGRLHRLQVRRGQGLHGTGRHGLDDWEVQRANGGRWEAAELGAVETCVQNGASVATEQRERAAGGDSAYWPTDATACERERQSGCHRLLERALEQHGNAAAQKIRAVETAMHRRAAQRWLPAAPACGGAHWGGESTGLGVPVGAKSDLLREVRGTNAAGLDWLTGCAELEVAQVGVDHARVRERVAGKRRGEGGNDWRGAGYIAGGERPGKDELAVYTVVRAGRLAGVQRGLVRVQLGVGYLDAGGRQGRLLAAGTAVVIRAETVQNWGAKREDQAAAIAEIGRWCRAMGLGPAEGLIAATGVRLNPTNLELSAEYSRAWTTARAAAERLAPLAGALGHDVERSVARAEGCSRLIGAMRMASMALERVHGHGLTVGRVEVGVFESGGGGDGGLVVGGMAGTGWAAGVSPKVAVRRAEYLGNSAEAVMQRERLVFTGLCRSLIHEAGAGRARILGVTGSEAEEAAAAAEETMALGASDLFNALSAFDLRGSLEGLDTLEPAFRSAAQRALWAVRRVRGLGGCCVDALVVEMVGAAPGTEWAAGVGAMRQQARVTRADLWNLPSHGPIPAGLVQEYTEHFGLNLVVARNTRPWGVPDEEGEQHLWWAAGESAGEGKGRTRVLAVATFGRGGRGHVELLGEGELRDVLELELSTWGVRRGGEWEHRGRVAENGTGTIRLLYQGAEIAMAWDGPGTKVGGPVAGECDCGETSVAASGVLNMDVSGYEGRGRGGGRDAAAGRTGDRTAPAQCLSGRGRWERVADALRGAVTTGGAVLAQWGRGGRTLEAAREEWEAWLGSGAGGRITPSGSNGGAVDLREFAGPGAGAGWFKVYGLGMDAEGDVGPVVRWATSEQGRGAQWLMRAREQMRHAGIGEVHGAAPAREVTFMASGSPPAHGEVHFDEFDSLSVVVTGGKTWYFLMDADMEREYGPHPGAGPANERIDVVPDTARGWQQVRQNAGDILAMPSGLWHSVVSDAGTNAIGEWYERRNGMGGRPRVGVSGAEAWPDWGRGRAQEGDPSQGRARPGRADEGRGGGRGGVRQSAAGPGTGVSPPASPPGSDSEEDTAGEGARVHPAATGGAAHDHRNPGAPQVAGVEEGVAVMAEVVTGELGDGEADAVVEVECAEVMAGGSAGTPGPEGDAQACWREFNWRDWGRQGGTEAGGWPTGEAAATLSGERYDGLAAARAQDGRGLPVLGTERRVRPTGEMDAAGRHLRVHRHDAGAQERWRRAAGDVPRSTRMVEGIEEMREAVYECQTRGCAALVPARTRHEGRGCTAVGCVKKKNYRPTAHVSTQLDRIGMLRRGERALMQRLAQGTTLGWEQQSETEMLRAAERAERAAVASAKNPVGGVQPWGGWRRTGGPRTCTDEGGPAARTRLGRQSGSTESPMRMACLDVAFAEGRGGGHRIEGPKAWMHWCAAQREEARLTCGAPEAGWLVRGEPVPVGMVDMYARGLGLSVIVFRVGLMADGQRRQMRVWWLGTEGDDRTEWTVLEATGAGHCAFVGTVCGADVAELVQERREEWAGDDRACTVVGYEYGLAGAWPESEAVGMTDETARAWRQRSMLRRASSRGREAEEGRREGDRPVGGAGRVNRAGDEERWEARLRARGTEPGMYAEGLAGGGGAGRGDTPTEAAEAAGTWAWEKEAPSALATLGRIYVWRRVCGRWRLQFVAAESAGLAGRGQRGEWGLYWAGRGGFEPEKEGDGVGLGRYECTTEGERHSSITAAWEEASAREWTGRAMVCRRGQTWAVVEPRRDEGRGGWLHLMNDSRGTGVVENVRFREDGTFELHGAVGCFCGDLADTSERNGGAELLTVYGDDHFERERLERRLAATARAAPTSDHGRRARGRHDDVGGGGGAGGEGGEGAAADEGAGRTTGAGARRGAGGAGGAAGDDSAVGPAACVDEAIALGRRALAAGAGGAAGAHNPFAMSRTEVAAQRRAAGDAAGRPGSICRGLPAAGPVDAGLIDAYAAAMGMRLAVYRVAGDDLHVWWRSACAACRGQHRAHGPDGGCRASTAAGRLATVEREAEAWVVWRAEGAGHAEYVGRAAAASAIDAVRACTWEAARSERRGGKLAEDCRGVAGAWGGAGHPVGMLNEGGGGRWRAFGASGGGAAGEGGGGTGSTARAAGERDGGATAQWAGGGVGTGEETPDRSGAGVAEAEEAVQAAARLAPVRGLGLADAVVRQWSGHDSFDFWLAGGGTRARRLQDVARAAALTCGEGDDTLVFFARQDGDGGADDWASGTVRELRGAVVDLIAITLGQATVWSARRGLWAGVGGPMACPQCGASVTCREEASDVAAFCPSCWDEWVEGARVLRNARCVGCEQGATCLGERGWGVDATARGWYSGDYCWGCWMAWATGEGRWMVVRSAVEREARTAHRHAVQGASGSADEDAAAAGRGTRETASAGEGDGGAGTARGREAEGGAERVVHWPEVERDCWGSGSPPVFFYSWGTEATWMSSMSVAHGFWGVAAGDAEVAEILQGRQLQRFFKSRETWFCYVKCLFAASGAEGQRSVELADEVLRMLPKLAKRAGQAAGRGGRLAGLDVAAWDRVKIRVMAEGAWMQARGNADFRGRLLRTGGALLLEASATDGFWGIGMDAPTAARVPPAARRSTFGTNWHGATLMMARERIRREEGTGVGWKARWGGPEGGGGASPAMAQ